MAAEAFSRRRHGAIRALAALYGGVAYLIAPHDLIPDATRFGLTDDATVLLACAVLAWVLSPPAPRQAFLLAARFRIRVLRADLGNFGPVQHDYVDGFVISGKNSGSHWLKYMLSVALAQTYGLDPPRFTSGRHADALVGRASRSRTGRHYPQIATSHTIPSILLAWLPLRLFRRQPPIVLLVRDLPDALCSHYAKWQDRYDTSFQTYLAGDPSGRRFMADVWWYIHFWNRWAAIMRRQPSRIMLLRYEDLHQAPARSLDMVARHLRLPLSPCAIAAAVAAGAKDRMRDLQDPNAGEVIIPSGTSRPPLLSPTDQDMLAGILRRYLAIPLPYGTPPPPDQTIPPRDVPAPFSDRELVKATQRTAG